MSRPVRRAVGSLMACLAAGAFGAVLLGCRMEAGGAAPPSPRVIRPASPAPVPTHPVPLDEEQRYPVEPQPHCPRLNAALDAAATSWDPERDAAAHGLTYVREKVLVTITLRGPAEDQAVRGDLALRYGLNVFGGLHPYFDVYAPLGSLCILLDDPAVGRVDPAYEGELLADLV